MYNPRENINSIFSIKNRGKFDKFIDFICFPYYRNMETDSIINFTFPLTVIIGQNGCGKSSLLHAIYGMPQRYTPYKFWFDTKVDPIEYYNDERKRHSFWYQYTENGIIRQVVKARIRRGDDPNYWETSRPLQWAGMTALERHTPVEKNVVYLDFRSELSAFDKYFYFGDTRKSKAKNKQEFIRRKSSFLKKALTNENYVAHSKGRNLNKPVRRLNTNELNIISYILGREYKEALSIFHSFFRNDGYSVLFRTTHANYSEAFAGSGEMAVTRLVYEVLNAPEFSLIILDEPEVSLHPGAQERLTNFLLEEIKRKKHQIIITSHSPSIVKNLPKEAIKVLYQNPNSGRFFVKENLLPEEAFYHIEFVIGNKKRIHFEDKLALGIINSVLKILGKEKESLFELVYNPGGSSVMSSEFAKIFCRTDNSNDFMIFDGDQRKAEHIDWRDLPSTDLTALKLKEKVLSQTGCEIKFYVDGGSTGSNDQQKIDLYKRYLDYYKRNVFYLPKNIPEEIIWDDDTALNLLKNIISEEDANRLIYRWNTSLNYKEKFSQLSSYMFGQENNSSEKIFNAQILFIQVWLRKEGEDYKYIVSLIEHISNL